MAALISSIKLRLPYILLGVFTMLILLLGASIVLYTHRLTKHVETYEDVSYVNFRSQVRSEAETITKILNLTSTSSTIYLQRVLSSALNLTKLSFSDIENNVAPYLFQVLSMTPHLTHISFIGFYGLFFSYYKDGSHIFSLYSNASSVDHTFNASCPNDTSYLYTQMANRDTGKLYGNVQSFPSKSVFNYPRWFQEALNGKSGSHAFLGTKWNKGQDLLFINTASVNGNLGLVSLGFSVEEVMRYYTDINLRGGKSCLITEDGKFIVGDSIFSFDLMKEKNAQPSVSCFSNGTLNTRGFNLQIEEISCSQLHVLGIKSVYVLAMKKSGFVSLVHKYRTIILIFLTLTIVIMLIIISSSLPIIHIVVRGEVYLNSKLTKQVNEIEQAERKSTNKSHAFATASHDIRASLAGMIGLIKISYNEVASGSDLETNLRQLEGCTKDLSSMLTSILDVSKIEAGKMLLEEEEFDVFQLFEDVVDLYHPVGAMKGVDVIFDRFDGSISEFSPIKSDKVKLRQILTNLLSNAVKFTLDGQVIVRAWIRKPEMKNTTIKSNQCSNNGFIWSLACIFFNERENESSKPMRFIEKGHDYMELVCEVDDTGKGIPKDKRNEVFEKYVQVKETALGQVGTGLGLGIVKSLVRLMHGEIEIMDKDIGEKGSCFRFNIPITICDNVSVTSKEELNKDCELMRSPQSGPRALIPSPSKPEGSCVVLLIQNNERRKLAEKFMERLGIRVFSLKCPDELSLTLKRMQSMIKWNRSLDFGKQIESLCIESPMSQTIDGPDSLRAHLENIDHFGGTLPIGFVLLIMDANAGKLSELCETTREFRNSLQESVFCRVVWLENHESQSTSLKSSLIGESTYALDDIIVKHKPLHGSRLFEVARLLPEFGGPLLTKNSESSFSRERISGKINVSKSLTLDKEINDQSHAKSSQSEVEQAVCPSKEKPLFGKKILVVDDTLLQRKIARLTVEKLGAAVENCENGLEAFELVCKGVFNLRKQGDSMINALPYDYILMDCEMPVMDGYDATCEIRKVEKLYGIHIPIIALTAHMPGSEEADRTISAGMDAFLCRPLKAKDLIEVINSIGG